MTQIELLAMIGERLEAAGIPHMVVGSYGSSLHGSPRTTQDIDLVIDPTDVQMHHFVESFRGQEDRFYLSATAASDALRDRGMFNILDLEHSWKVDLIVRKNRPFSIEEFGRRRMENLHGRKTPVATPEDVILSKLEWDKITPSERQVQDAANVLLVQHSKVDLDYLRRWADELGISERLKEILALTQSGGDQRL